MENNSFLCTICGSSFRERWELHSHTQKSHDTRVFKCTICEKEVVGQRKMEGHKQSHKKKSCNICWIQIPINSLSNHRAKCEGIMLHCDLLLLAKADGVPETYHNIKILLDSLDLPSLSEDFQIVCDLKIINISWNSLGHGRRTGFTCQPP